MFNSIRLVDKPSSGALVVGVFTDRKLDKATKVLDTSGTIAAAVARGECTGEAGKLCEAFPMGKGAPSRVIIVGLGKREEFKPGGLRAIGGQIGRRMVATKDTTARIELAGVLEEIAKLDMEHAGRCLGEGLGLIGWKNWLFKGTAGDEKPKRLDLSVSASGKAFVAGIGRGLALAQSANLCRDLSETPPNIATPEWISTPSTPPRARIGA